MLSYVIAASLIASAPLLAECNCSPEKIEALKAKLKAEGASKEKVDAVNCDDVCQAEEKKTLANATEEEHTSEVANTDVEKSESELANADIEKENSTLVDADVEKEESTLADAGTEEKSSEIDSVLAGCGCGSKKTREG